MTQPDLRPQRRGRKIAMTDEERDAFLAGERTCRVATIGADGPHATPLWFGWDGTYLWLYSIVKSQRWTDLQRDPRIGVTVDTGVEYLELRGVEITGTVEVVGEAPRTGGAAARGGRDGEAVRPQVHERAGRAQRADVPRRPARLAARDARRRSPAGTSASSPTL